MNQCWEIRKKLKPASIFNYFLKKSPIHVNVAYLHRPSSPMTSDCLVPSTLAMSTKLYKVIFFHVYRQNLAKSLRMHVCWTILNMIRWFSAKVKFWLAFVFKSCFLFSWRSRSRPWAQAPLMNIWYGRAIQMIFWIELSLYLLDNSFLKDKSHSFFRLLFSIAHLSS